MLRSTADIVPVNLDNIPIQLRDLTRWVLWKPLPQDDEPDVLAKSPFDCRFTDDRASSTRPETWSDFATASAAYDARQTNGAGGLMVALGEGLAGVDLDDAIEMLEVEVRQVLAGQHHGLIDTEFSRLPCLRRSSNMTGDHPPVGRGLSCDGGSDFRHLGAGGVSGGQ
jgi:hypothetical protein